ncbi:DUF4397 domain-containing protein [Herbidospora mongoliensis]|uniref:DUF4397 domain-containing protein n=1 Tax=Herbidospora mongoliensis TaxID=688067 RepID=UPI001470FAB1|nr:DUF4397 domain-containing protein [Herbidospora mongoliensis]
MARLFAGALLIIVCTATPAHAAPQVGHVRLAHLSPDTPAVDVYLYPFGGDRAKLVLNAVPYGGVSPYQNLTAGQYTVAMRPAGAAASTQPVLSANVRVEGGHAYTVAGMGPYESIRLQVLNDSLELPDGKAGLRVIAASLKERNVTITAGGMEEDLRFADTPEYTEIDAAMQKITAQAGDESASADVRLTAGSTNTVVVLDGDRGLRLLPLTDAAAPGVTPRGAVDTGMGGLAPKGTSVWWFALAGALVLAGTAFLVRLRHPSGRTT